MSNEKNFMLEDLKRLIFGSDTFEIILNNQGHEIKIVMRCLTMDEIMQIEKLLESRKITPDNFSVYMNELRILKIIYAIEKIIIDNVEMAIKDREALEKALRNMPEYVVRMLQMKYEEYNVKIYDMLEKKN